MSLRAFQGVRDLSAEPRDQRASLSSVERVDEPREKPCLSRKADAVRPRVLVTDDNVDAAQSFALWLDLMGYDVCVAHDGSEALGLAAGFKPDIIFMDICMPGMNGWDTARRLREIDCCKSAVIVALSAWAKESDKARSLSAGMNHHLVKPADPRELDQVLKSAELLRML